jgi:hypothetical protein
MTYLSAGLLALALQNPFLAAPEVKGIDLSAAAFTFEGSTDVGLWTAPMTISAVTAGKMTAVFGLKPRAGGWQDDMDYRCGLVISRDGKNGWLVDRLENTPVRWEGTTLPEWCNE